MITLEEFADIHKETEKGDLIRLLYEAYRDLRAAHEELDEANDLPGL